MAKCININHPEFKKLASKSGIHPAILAAEMGVWMEKNNTDEWPRLEQLDIFKQVNLSPTDTQLFKTFLQESTDITVKDIEKHIAGLADTFSKRKFNGHYTVRREDIINVGFSRAQMARNIVAEINRIVPNLLYLEENPIYYKDQKTGDYLRDKKTNELVKRGDTWLKLIINEDALKDYLESKAFPEFEFQASDNLTEEHIKELGDNIPEFKDSIGDKLPMEFDQFENPEADPRLVNIIYTEAQKVRNLLDEYIEDRTNPMMLLATIESRVGLSDANNELRKVLEPLSGYLSQVELKIITRNDLHTIERGAFKQHISDFGFTHMSAKDNKRVIYLIKDNLDRPGDGSFDLVASTVLHELYHNILFEAIDNPVTEDEKQLAKEVTNLFKAAKSQTSYKNSPAYKNIQEFVVQGLTNHKIVSELKGMQYNWWQRFIRAIVNFFTKNTDAGVEGKSLTYYDSLFNSVIGYVNKQRKLKPLLYAEVTLAADDADFFIRATTKKASLSDNAKYLSTQLNNKLKAYHNYVGNVAPTEAQFISVEHGLNILGLSGVSSDLIAKEKDLSKLEYNKAYSTIRSAIDNYKGRTNIVDKERVIEMLESKFGKDAAIVTNAMVYNIERKLFDVIDFVVIHKYENTESPVYSIVNFYESNGTMSTFKDTIIPKKKGVYRPMSKKNRERVRLSFSAGLLNRSIDKDHKYNAYSINVIPINEDANGNATVEAGITKLELSRSTFFLWSENFDKARAQAYDDLQANIDLDLSEEVQTKINEYYSKIEMEEFNLSVADKLLQRAVKMLNTRANVSKMYGRKLAVIEIEKLVTDMVLNYQEPREGIIELVNYIHKELTKATKVLSETDLENKKINKNALTAFIKMTKSFEIIKDINVYFKSIKEDIPELKEIRSKISESIEALATIEIEYKNRAINLLVDYLAPYYSRLKYEQIEKYKQNYRLFQHRLKEQEKGNAKYTDKFVPKNFNRNLTEEEYVSTQYKLNEAAIKDGTRHIIAKELTQASKDIGYLELMVDNILDTGDAVVGSFVKSLAIVDDERRLAVEEKRMQYLPILEEYEKYLSNTGKVFTNYLDMYEFMLERDPDTNKLTGHILTEFSSELLEEKKVVFLSTEIYNDREEAKKVRSAWLNENMPINTSKYIDALWEYVKTLATSGKINEKDLKTINKIILNNTKYIDIKYFVDEGIITEEIGDNLFEWIATNQNRFREPADHWQTKQWKELKKILDNKDDPRTKVYNAIIELRDYADSLVPASRGVNNRLPGVVKQKAERIATGQPIHTLITDSLAKTFTFQVDDTHRHSEIITEDKEALYFIPIHYNKRIVKTTEDGVVRFDEDNQSFDLFGIYFSYMSSAIEYNKKHALLAEIDMFKNLMKQRELIKNSSLTETLKTIKEKPSDILKLGTKEEAVVVGGNMYQMLNAWLNATVFGQSEQDLGTFLGMDVGKIIEFIKKYTAVNLLGLNIIQGVANVSLGEINQWIESIAGEFFKPKDYGRAHIDYMRNFAGMIADAGSRRPTNILTLIAQHFDMSDMPSVQRIGKQSKIGSMSLNDMAHLTSSSGEHFMRIKFMDAMLYEKKAFDKDGNEIGSIRDFYSVEDGKLTFDKEGKVDIVRSMWTVEDQNDFKQRLEGLLGRIHGDYSNLARVYIQGHPVASMAYMFRKFLAPGWRRHWGKHRYETRNLQSVEGMYVTTFNFLFKPFIDAFKAKRNLEAEESEILDLTWGERWAMLSDHQRANLMRTALEMVNIAIIMIMFRLLGGDDDDEITYSDEFIMYQLLRLKSEILFFLSPFEAMKILRSPAASMSVFENTFQLFKQAMNPLEVYERGPWEGQLKVYKRLVNMVPVYRQAYRLRDVGDQIPWFQR
jgi:hypothetical protein